MTHTISVILPVYNDPVGLAETLECLMAQDYAMGYWEVIIVDNGSTDNTLQVAKEYSQQTPHFRVVTENAKGAYAARNKGIALSAATICAFIDADMLVDADWITQGVRCLAQGIGDYVGGQIEVFGKHNPPTIIEIYERKTAFPNKIYIEDYGFSIGGSIFVWRKVIDAVGFFDERLLSGGDKEFGNRIRDAGFQLGFSPDIRHRHPARATLRALCRKRYRIGRGVADLHHHYPERYGDSSLVAILSTLRPTISVSRMARFLDISDLTEPQKREMLFVVNVVNFAWHLGQMIRTLEWRFYLF